MGIPREQLAVALLAAVAVAIFACAVAGPMAARLDQIEQATYLLQADHAGRGVAARAALADMPAVEQCRARMRAARQQIPVNSQVGPLLEKLADVSSTLQMSDQNITPQASYTDSDMGVLPIEMTFESSFMSLFAFLQRVESLERTVRVARIEAHRDEDASSMLKTRLLLQVFFDPNGDR